MERSRRTAFSTFKRSTGHRSSSESNRNERGSPLVTVISQWLLCLSVRQGGQFLQPPSWPLDRGNGACFRPVRFNGRRWYLLFANAFKIAIFTKKNTLQSLLWQLPLWKFVTRSCYRLIDISKYRIIMKFVNVSMLWIIKIVCNVNFNWENTEQL